MKKIAALLLALVMILGCTAAMAETAEKPLAGQHLNVAMSANYKYFETIAIDENGKETYVGLDVDILAELADRLGFTYTINNMPFASLIGSLQASQADLVISGMSWTEERAKSVDFSTGYATVKVGCLVPAESEITSLEQLNGKAVACSAGTNYENMVKQIEGAELKTYDGQAAVTQELLVGRVDAAITGATACKNVCESNPGLTYFIIDTSKLKLTSRSTYNIAFPKGSENVALFDAAIEELKADGTIDAILTNWLGEDFVK
ncbi:MAG: amino acid ABC transporter substrate-binding protein [Clostridia bacterium]|nr:amino acid ABC transporter substrate-binding protein [Clostridia bacterium]